MTDYVHLVAFVSLGAMVVVPAIYIVSTRNLVHAGFALLPCLIGVAGLYALLEAHFFVVVQVLVYIGAILVLILFALMLTRDVMDTRERQTNALGIWAGLACGMGLLGAAVVVSTHPWPASTDAPAGAHDQVVVLGRALIRTHPLPFEAVSLILLAALIGAIAIARVPRASSAAERREEPR